MSKKCSALILFGTMTTTEYPNLIRVLEGHDASVPDDDGDFNLVTSFDETIYSGFVIPDTSRHAEIPQDILEVLNGIESLAWSWTGNFDGTSGIVQVGIGSKGVMHTLMHLENELMFSVEEIQKVAANLEMGNSVEEEVAEMQQAYLTPGRIQLVPPIPASTHSSTPVNPSEMAKDLVRVFKDIEICHEVLKELSASRRVYDLTPYEIAEIMSERGMSVPVEELSTMLRNQLNTARAQNEFPFDN